MIFIQSIRSNDVNPDSGKQIELSSAFFTPFGWQPDQDYNVTIHYNGVNIHTTFRVRGSERGGTRVGVDCKEYANSRRQLPLKELFINSIGLKPEHIDRVSFILESINEEGLEFNLYFANLPNVGSRNSISLPFCKSNSQCIKFGAPGTGKSQSLKKLEDNGAQKCIRTTFHPESDYGSFVGSYKPISDNRGKITYRFVEQAFLEAYYKAWNNPNKSFTLLIEEINRGNCAQIFGDIFQLLDRREDGFSSYPITADLDLQKQMRDNLPQNYDLIIRALYLDHNNVPLIDDGWSVLALPSNLSIYATMNTSDQSLYKMDSAFKRRWKMEYVPIKYKAKLKEDGTPIEGEEGLYRLEKVHLDFYDKSPWLEILYSINAFIRNRLDSTSKQMGQWFIVPEKEGEDFVDIPFEVFRDKLVFYLFNDVFKKSDILNQPFGKEEDGSLFLFEDLCTEKDGGKALCETFLDNVTKDFPYPKD